MEYIETGLEYLNSISTSIFITILLVLVTLYYWPIWDSYKYPPGPIPLPFLENRLLLLRKYSSSFSKYLYENRDKYGSVVTLRCGGPEVWLNSPEAIYEGLVKNADSLSNRPINSDNPIVELGVQTPGGIIDSPDGVWQLHRRLLLTVFREQGVGKTGMEEVICEEIKYFHEALQGHKGQPIDLHNQLQQTISNVATHIIFGRRFDYSTDQLDNLQISPYFGVFFLTQSAPLLRHLPFDPTGFQAAKKRIMSTMKFIEKQIAEHEETIDYDNPRDFIDTFLVEKRNSSSSNKDYYTDNHLISVVFQIYVAGTDTTSSSLYWAFLYLIRMPQIQDKILREIQEQVGDRAPTYSDRPNMPYTMSFISELLRIDIAQSSLSHIASQDTVVQGHTIPKGTEVVANLYANTHNPEFFDSPDEFRPDRFLDSDGKFVKPDSKHLTPFSLGRRSCPGDRLANMELFLFLTHTIQKFKILLGQDELPSNEGVVKFTYIPRSYKIRLAERD